MAKEIQLTERLLQTDYQRVRVTEELQLLASFALGPRKNFRRARSQYIPQVGSYSAEPRSASRNHGSLHPGAKEPLRVFVQEVNIASFQSPGQKNTIGVLDQPSEFFTSVVVH